jgi:transcriptional regulator with XRE-family HTH domain
MASSGELAAFLRARRERLSPEDVGLPRSGRRRTPGLRREELAALAGLSMDYLVRLEQGRDTNPSAAVVANLARALRLSPDERRHLGHLVAVSSMSELCPAAVPLPTEVRPTVHALLERLDPTPAFVVGPIKDVLAANDAWRALVAPMGLLDRDPVSLPSFTFLDPRAREAFPDWDHQADEQVSQLRAARTHWSGDPRFTEVITALHASPEFERRWETHLVGGLHAGTKRLLHPQVGELRVAFEALALADDDQLLVTWLPADEAAAAALGDAVGVPEPVSPARLRVVAEA